MEDELRERWQAWERLPYPAHVYPPGGEDSAPGGVDLALADGDAGAVFGEYFADGALSPAGVAVLDPLIEDLARVVPMLHSDAQGYFQEAMDLLRAVRAAAGNR